MEGRGIVEVWNILFARTVSCSLISICAVDSIPRRCAIASLRIPYFARVKPRNERRSSLRSRTKRFISAMMKAASSDASWFLRVCAKSLPRASYRPLGRMWYQFAGIAEALGEFLIVVRRGFGMACMSFRATFGSWSELGGLDYCSAVDVVRCGEPGACPGVR